MPRNLKKSIVWEFFNKNFENGKVISVQCKKCNMVYNYFGNTTNLHDHLKRKHSMQKAKVQEQLRKKPRCFKKSIVWECFNKNFENGNVISVQCKKCDVVYKYCGNTTNLHDHLKRKHSNTTNLNDHLKRKHPIQKKAKVQAQPRKIPRPFKKSIVWEFFNKNFENGNVISVQCNKCDMVYKYFGNTTNLHDHLKRKHPVHLAEIQEQQNSTENDPLDTKLSITDPLIVHESTKSNSQPLNASASPAKRMKQENLYDATQKSDSTEKSQPTDDERHEFEKDLMRMIAVDCQPLSIVENRGFDFFIKKYVPCHQLPSRKELSETVLPEIYQSLSSNLRNTLDKTKYISITTDMWSSDNHKAYITVTAHFVYEYKIRSSVLSTEELQTDHSAVNIAQVILKIFNKWQITDKIVAVVTDNAAKMETTVLENLQKYHYPCIAHTLDLSLQDTVKENEGLANLLTKCRSLVTYFKQSKLAAYKLRKVHEQMGLQELKLKQDVPTKWNSAVTMMETLSKMKSPLTAAISSLVKAPTNLNISEWEAVDDCVQILKLALFMTEDLSSEMYPTMSRITPLIKGLQVKIRNKNVTTDIGRQLKLSLEEIISRRLSFIETTEAVAKATFLDPRFKKAAFGTVENADNAQQWVTDELCKLIHSSQNANDSHDSQLPNSSTTNCSRRTKAHNELWSHFDEKVSAVTSSITPNTSAKMMVKQYLEMPYLDRKNDPLDFWKSHIHTFPYLYILASKYLHIPATSVPAERIFSKAAMVSSEKRNRLEPKKLNEFLFISDNVELIT